MFNFLTFTLTDKEMKHSFSDHPSWQQPTKEIHGLVQHPPDLV
jgi:hypothetical protein